MIANISLNIEFTTPTFSPSVLTTFNFIKILPGVFPKRYMNIKLYKINNIVMDNDIAKKVPLLVCLKIYVLIIINGKKSLNQST